MKLKKFLAGVGALLLCPALLLPVPAQAADWSGSTTTITARVPDTHTVLLDIGEHGSVLINGRTYTSKDKQVEIARLAEQTYAIQPDDGWQTGMILYGEADAQEAVTLTDNAFTAPAISSDSHKLTVTFTKSPAGTGDVQTGDTNHLCFLSVLLAVSAFASLILIRRSLASSRRL